MQRIRNSFATRHVTSKRQKIETIVRRAMQAELCYKGKIKIAINCVGILEHDEIVDEGRFVKWNRLSVPIC